MSLKLHPEGVGGVARSITIRRANRSIEVVKRYYEQIDSARRHVVELEVLSVIELIML